SLAYAAVSASRWAGKGIGFHTIRGLRRRGRRRRAVVVAAPVAVVGAGADAGAESAVVVKPAEGSVVAIGPEPEPAVPAEASVPTSSTIAPSAPTAATAMMASSGPRPRRRNIGTAYARRPKTASCRGFSHVLACGAILRLWKS